MSIIDMHTHFSLETSGIAEDAEAIGFAVENKSVEAHLEMMDRLDIGWALLSDPTLKFLDDAEKCVAYCRQVNDTGSGITKAYPDRFGFAAVLPLPYIENTLEELRRIRLLPGCRAIGLCSNYGGLYLGDPSLEPVFDTIEKMGIPMILHPAAPPAYPAGPVTGKILPMFEFIADTTRTVLDLFASGTLLRHPGLKLVIPHCGSCLPSALDRFHGILRAVGKDVDVPSDQLYYDLACDSFPNAVLNLLNFTDTGHIVYGSDFPAIPLPVLVKHVEAARSCPAFAGRTEDILKNNAEKLLGL